MIRLLVCGDRNWMDRKTILETMIIFSKVHTIFHLIHGNCRGADLLAHDAVTSHLEMLSTSVPARWAHNGNAAGPIRNTFMLHYGKPDYVIAFHAKLKESKGTKDMCDKACAAGVPVFIIRGSEDLQGLEDKIKNASV